MSNVKRELDDELRDSVIILDTANAGYNWVFNRYAEKIFNVSYIQGTAMVEKNIHRARFVVFTGGPDINPMRYHEATHPTTHYSDARDVFEFAVADMCMKHNVPMVGICRGVQFGCVYAGGKLMQDTKDHNGTVNYRHSATLPAWPKFKFNVSSDHHQIVLPFKTEHAIIARAWDTTVEAIYFEDIRFLGVQFHPEWMGAADDAVLLFHAMVQQYVLGRALRMLDTVDAIEKSRRLGGSGHNTVWPPEKSRPSHLTTPGPASSTNTALAKSTINKPVYHTPAKKVDKPKFAFENGNKRAIKE